MSKEKKMIEGQLSLFDLFGATPEAVPEVNRMDKTVPKAFLVCSECWCRDCRHNAVNEGVPRDLCGNMQPCPACDMCVKSNDPQICIIGSAKEGCSVRAAEEGIEE